jgi:hypothetical protein
MFLNFILCPSSLISDTQSYHLLKTGKIPIQLTAVDVFLMQQCTGNVFCENLPKYGKNSDSDEPRQISGISEYLHFTTFLPHANDFC